ncbi:MAG: right-handed parallel beta-helix repeat-containing protein [Phaeodactylibacter sp.]|nr:right-handed parallel beta-helix repeat-containing protein [Phaeodactylibacter sp.]
MKMKALIIALGLILASSSLLLAQYPPIPSPTDPDPLPTPTPPSEESAQHPVAKCQNVTKYIGSDCLVEITPDDIDAGSLYYLQRSISKNTFSCSDKGANTVTLTLIQPGPFADVDKQLDTATCTATVTIYGDATATCLDKTVSLDASGKAHIEPEALSANDPDDLAIDALFLSRQDFDCMDVGPNPVILTVINKSGTQNSCSATVTVEGSPDAPCTSTRWYVNDEDGNDDNDGRSWQAPFQSLQKAIESAKFGDHIWVAGGTYQPSAYPRNATQTDGSALPENERYYTFHLPDGVQLYGGFAGTETYLSERNMGLHPSILDGNQGFHVVISVSAGAESVLDGFVITGGRATYLGNAILVDGVMVSSANGGGISFSQSSATVRNVAVVNNTASAEGGGIMIIEASPKLTNVTVAANSSSRQGGGIYATASAFPTLTNATVANNTAGNGGNGLYVYNSSSKATVYNSVFYNNGSSQDILNSSGATITGSNNYTQQAPSGYGSPSGFKKLNRNPFAKSSNPDGADNIFGTTDDGLKPGNYSELNGAGNCLLNSTSIDLLGNCRVEDGTMEVGAYEK